MGCLSCKTQSWEDGKEKGSRVLKRRGRKLSADGSSKEELEASSVFEDTVHEAVAVPSDRNRLSSANFHVQRSHFYENFGEIEFWRKPSVSHSTVYEIPVRWTGLPPHAHVTKKKGRDSSNNADSSHVQLKLPDATGDASQKNQALSRSFSHAVHPRKKCIAKRLSVPVASRKVCRSAEDNTANNFENAKRENELINGSSRKEGRGTEDEFEESSVLPQMGVMYESDYIPMHSARCTSCPNLPDVDLEEDDLYVTMDVHMGQAGESAEANTSVMYYNVPARIAGIPATHFMPGPLYCLPSSHPLPPRAIPT